MSNYFTAAFFSESGFPSKVAFQEFCIREPSKTDPVNKQLSALVKQGQSALKTLYTENHLQIKRLDQERKTTNKILASKEKETHKRIQELLESEDEIEEITPYQQPNPSREIHQLHEQLQLADERIQALEIELNSLNTKNQTLAENYQMLQNAFIDLTIEYETIRSKAPLPIKRKRHL